MKFWKLSRGPQIFLTVAMIPLILSLIPLLIFLLIVSRRALRQKPLQTRRLRPDEAFVVDVSPHTSSAAKSLPNHSEIR